MKVVDGYYLVEVKCTSETAQELMGWLEQNGQQLDRIESAIGDDAQSLRDVINAIAEHAGAGGVIIDLHLKDEEVALLTKMKFGK
jgi:hypothetical protein